MSGFDSPLSHGPGSLPGCPPRAPAWSRIDSGDLVTHSLSSPPPVCPSWAILRGRNHAAYIVPSGHFAPSTPRAAHNSRRAQLLRCIQTFAPLAFQENSAMSDDLPPWRPATSPGHPEPLETTNATAVPGPATPRNAADAPTPTTTPATVPHISASKRDRVHEIRRRRNHCPAPIPSSAALTTKAHQSITEAGNSPKALLTATLEGSNKKAAPAAPPSPLATIHPGRTSERRRARLTPAPPSGSSPGSQVQTMDLCRSPA